MQDQECVEKWCQVQITSSASYADLTLLNSVPQMFASLTLNPISACGGSRLSRSQMTESGLSHMDASMIGEDGTF